MEDRKRKSWREAGYARKLAGERALAWCESHMWREADPGFGGIWSASLSSGITGLPYLKVATGYANAYYILGKLLESR